MDYYKQFQEHNRVAVFELKGEVETRLRPYWYAQNTLMGSLFRGRLPANWREQWRATCAEQAEQGIITDPKSIQEIEDYLEAWAKFCGLEPREEAAATEYTITIERHEEDDTSEAPPPQKPKPLSPSWPELTPKEKEQAQSLTGLPWWYPLQPSNRMDSMWAGIFVRIGQEGRNKLESCYREIAALGRLVKAVENGHDDALEKLEAQRNRVQTAYDEYVLARAAINLEWASYLRTESCVGAENHAVGV
jgi:hypothetical protein